MNKKKSANNSKKESSYQCQQSINVLVVGDWIIDEDWVMMPERSETSAKQVDEKHFHTVFDELDVATKRLCGASLTASAIRGYLDKKNSNKADLNVFGMGVWYPKDDDYLEQLFQEDALQGTNPFNICRPTNVGVGRDEKRLFNLARENDKCSTTRVVRTFLGHPGTLPKSMSRYDWHLKWEPELKGSTFRETIEKRIQENLNEIKEKEVTFDAIVLADFNKGLITEDLIMSLTEKIQSLKSDKGLTWFFRSKQLETPKWYKDFSQKMGEGDKFIQFVDPRLAKKYAEGKQLIYGAEITSEGLEFLETHKPEHIPKPKMAVLFHDNSCIAYEEGDDSEKSNIWVLRSNEKPAYLTRGRSSIFLASLVIMELAKKKGFLINSDQGYSFGENCSIALSNGVQWCNDCLAIWKRKKVGKIMQVSANIKKAIQYIEAGSNVKLSHPYSWSKITKEWSQVKSKQNSCCISNSSKELRLEVWRAHTILNDYTALDDKRKENILNLNNSIRAFLELEDKEKKRPSFSLVKAEPGSGKTFLAKCLAKNFGLELFECNVAQLTGLEGLTHFFDQVDTAQRDGRKIFMFLDEVDSMVNGESTFGFILELMWCGQYYRNGLKNTLIPFPGIIAMSRDINSDPFKKDHPKFPDLISRIFGIVCELKNYTATESIYLFAKLLDKYFSQIAYVERGVLKTISKTEFKYGPRSLELLISLFKGIKRNMITTENLPSDNIIRELNEHFPNGLVRPDRYGENERKMVEIIYTAPVF